MKRIISYIFTYILVTVFVAVIGIGTVYIAEGASTDAKYELVYAQVEAADNDVYIVDTAKNSFLAFGDKYKFFQKVELSYVYEGNNYYVVKNLNVGSSDNSEMDFSGKYVKGRTVPVLVDKNHPNNFSDTERVGDDSNIKSVVIVIDVIVYIFFIVMFTVSFVQKERKIKNEGLYSEIKI